MTTKHVNKGFSVGRSISMTTPVGRNSAVYGFLILGALLVAFLSIVPTAHAAVPYVTSAKVTGPKTVTIIYSEPVNSSGADYFNLSGDLGGRALSAISGSGSNTVVLTLDSNVNGNAGGAVTINSSLLSTSSNSPFATTTVQITDGQPPLLSGITISSNALNNAFSKTGNVISLSFTANEPITNVAVTLLGHTLSASGSGAGPYSLYYTVFSSDTQDTVPVSITYNDAAGNAGSTSLSVSNSGTAVTTSSSQTTTTSTTVVTADYPASLYEVTRVPLVSDIQTPNYTFFSSTAGSITYIGSCKSATSMAVVGNNTVTFNPLSNGQYANCFITVTNSAGISNQLQISSFTIDTTKAPAIVTPVIPAATASTTPGVGCAPGALFSTTTGQACPSATAVPASGCLSGYAFSVVTGQACPVTSAAPVSTTTSAPATSSYRFTLSLRYGSESNEVLELQKRLKEEGYLSVTPNGYFGPSTEKAVKAYQKAHGISQLGNVGPATRAALNGQ